MGFTPAQQNAIDVRDRTLLVSAAAGSGKTFTLTQRIINSIIDDGQDLSRLLIVTFTRAAAGELKAKIARAVSNAIEQNPGNAHLQSQLIKLGGANISTIDSFFMEPVRSNFEKLGLPASIRMADDAELLPIREKLMREVLDEYFDLYRAYESGTLSSVGYSDRFTELVGILSETRDSSKLIPTLCDIYTRLLTSADGIDSLKRHAARFMQSESLEFFDTVEGKLLREYICEIMQYAYATMNDLAEFAASNDIFSKKAVVVFEDNKDTCQKLAQKAQVESYEALSKAFAEFSFGSLSVAGCSPSDELERAKSTRKDINKLITDTRDKYLKTSPQKIARDFRIYSEIGELLYGILSKFDEKYRKEKLSRGVCEFSDMPIYMLRLLLDENGNPTEYAENLSSSFDAVYIDEYQDVNEIQDRIFAIIGRDRRFMVGDIKQSIYGFREAEPSIFADYKQKFALYTKGSTAPSSGGGNTIFMSDNFRCDERIVDFTNLVCSGIFTSFAQSIGYTSNDDLRFAKEKPYIDYQSPRVVLDLIVPPAFDEGEDESDTDDSSNAKNLSDEAIVIANEIARLIRTEKNADGEPVRAGDIAIFARSVRHTKPLISALSILNIKYALSSKTELFETAEMKLLVALLEVVDNPHFDMPLCHLMTAGADSLEPLFSFEDVLTLKESSGVARSLYDATISYSEKNDDDLAQSCRDFVSMITKMRAAAGKMSADKMIKSLAFSEQFSKISTSAAYAYLYDCACKYVKSNWNSLHSFLSYFKKLMESGNVGGEPDRSKNDSVTVMTIHQSKGLEFKVCFLFGFGKKFNTSSKYNLVYNKDLGPTMKLPPIYSPEQTQVERLKTRYEDTLVRKTFTDHIKRKQIEEEARIFYVALTRAKERLYISATLKKPLKEITDSFKSCSDRNFMIKKSSSYIDWILLTLCNDGRRDELYVQNVFEKGSVSLTHPFPKTSMAEINDNVGEDEMSYAALYNEPAAQDKTQLLLSMIPSKIAASKATPDMLDKSVFIPLPAGKLFSESDEDASEPECDDERKIRERIALMRSQKTDFESLLLADKKPTAAERGTAAHQFLQFCDYDRVDKNGVEGEIEYLKEQRFISGRTASILKKDISKLSSFFESDLYRDARNTDAVHREFHFRMFRPASDFSQNPEMACVVSDKMILVQGSIDLIVNTADERLILCDYKTDSISKEEIDDRELLIGNMRKKHEHQLAQYKYAAQRIFGKSPDKIVLFLLSIGECIEV